MWWLCLHRCCKKPRLNLLEYLMGVDYDDCLFKWRKPSQIRTGLLSFNSHAGCSVWVCAPQHCDDTLPLHLAVKPHRTLTSLQWFVSKTTNKKTPFQFLRCNEHILQIPCAYKPIKTQIAISNRSISRLYFPKHIPLFMFSWVHPGIPASC